MDTNELKTILQIIKASARYKDGEVTFPAYMLELVWDNVGVTFERSYTEVIKKS